MLLKKAYFTALLLLTGNKGTTITAIKIATSNTTNMVLDF